MDIISIAETKLESLFPISQFLMSGFHKPFRMDVDRKRRGLLVYVKSLLPSKYLTNFKLPD